MSDADGHREIEPCDPPTDMTALSPLAPELELPAPHPARCQCCASLDDALAVIASLQSQIREANACIHGCTDAVTMERCPVHGRSIR